jgi:biopolymer transport protein ExbD
MPLKTHIDEQPTLNLTPMIDVVFLLIIFFMVGTQYSELERSLGLEVPQVTEGGALTAAPESRVVNVYRDGHVTLDRESVSLDQLTSKLSGARGQYPDIGVVVRGDGAGTFQRVAEVLNACKQAGISELAISVKLANEQR